MPGMRVFISQISLLPEQTKRIPGAAVPLDKPGWELSSWQDGSWSLGYLDDRNLHLSFQSYRNRRGIRAFDRLFDCLLCVVVRSCIPD